MRAIIRGSARVGRSRVLSTRRGSRSDLTGVDARAPEGLAGYPVAAPPRHSAGARTPPIPRGAVDLSPPPGVASRPSEVSGEADAWLRRVAKRRAVTWERKPTGANTLP